MNDRKYLEDYFYSEIKKIDIHEELKKVLMDRAFRDYAFYNYIPFNFYILYGKDKLNLNDIAKLSICSYLYFISILFFDKLVDKQAISFKTDRILLVRELIFVVQEYAIRGLSSILYRDFWICFSKLKSEYFNKRHINTDLESLSDKSILVHAYVLAIKSLIDDTDESSCDSILNAFRA